MADSDFYKEFRRPMDDPYAEIPLEALSQDPAQIEPIHPPSPDADFYSEFRRPAEFETTTAQSTGWEKTKDVGLGMTHGMVENVASSGELGAKVAPWLLPFMPKNKFFRDWLSEQMGEGADALRGLSPLEDGPQTPEQHLGADLAPIAEMALGGVAAGPGRVLAKKASQVGGRMLDDHITHRSMMGTGRGEEAAARLQKVGTTNPAELRNLDEAEELRQIAGGKMNDSATLPGALDEAMAPLPRQMSPEDWMNPRVNNPVRVKLFDFIENDRRARVFLDKNGNPKGLLKRMMASDGMNVKEYMDIVQTVGDELRTPAWKLTGKRKVKHSAYSQFARILDEFGDSLPPTEALKQFGRGKKLYRVAADYRRLRDIFEKGITETNGQQVFRPDKVIRELEKMKRKNPKEVARLFGPKIDRALNSLRRAGRSSAERYDRRNRTLTEQVMAYMTFMGVFRYARKAGRAASHHLFGTSMARPGIGR
jgi:hypothetical protein